MQVAIKIVLGLVLVWFALLAFMPKTELYYKLEEELAKKGIKINEDSIEENPFMLTIKGMKVYTEGIEVAKIEEVTLFMTLFYNYLHIQNVVTDDLVASESVKRIDDAMLNYSVVTPLVAQIDMNGSMGVTEGYVEILERSVRLDIFEPKETHAIEKYLTKEGKGWYY